MTEQGKLGRVIETDVLVIGAGIAGLFAAVRSKKFVNHVTLVDKGPVGHTSQCYYATGGHQSFLPGHDMDAWVQEVLYFEDGLCEQDIVESIYKETFDRIKDLESYGVRFLEGPDHGYRLLTTRGLAHIRKVFPYPHLAGGRKLIQALFEETNRLGVHSLSNIFIIGILKNGGNAVGAVGVDRKSGEFYIFKAGAIIVATGQCSFKGQYADQFFLTGDGMVMALKAGAELKNLEFATLWMQASTFCWEGLGNAFPLGAKLLNAKGEEFMQRYSPTLKSEIDYNFQARAMAMEARAGRGPFYVDHSYMKPENREFMRKPEGWMALHIKKLREAGISPYDEKFEVIPVFWTAQGIKADINCSTVVPGLFVAGRVWSIDPGVTMGSWSIGAATVQGYRAGENAARFAQKQKSPKINQDEVNMFKEGFFSPLGKTGKEPEQVLLEIQNVIFASEVIILKSESNLKRALQQIETLRDELLPQMGAKDMHNLVELAEVKNMTLIAEAMLRASLLRTESRASHYREDYPDRDDKNWLKWILVTFNHGKLSLRTESLPFNKYKFKPSRYYSDNFRIP
jgi:succinate dehydrogenase/fumarate reductase flavoprotein subunit